MNIIPLQLSIFRDIPPAEVCPGDGRCEGTVLPDLPREEAAPAEYPERPTLLFPWVR